MKHQTEDMHGLCVARDVSFWGKGGPPPSKNIEEQEWHQLRSRFTSHPSGSRCVQHRPIAPGTDQD